jgi:hypothetical protein
MRPVTAGFALAAVLALLPASAHAKEVASARACDADGCNAITDRGTLRQMEEGAPTDAPAAGAPFHRVRMTVKVPGEKDHVYTMVYVPSKALMRFGDARVGYEWLAATPRSERAFERLVRGLEPLPARRLRAAAVEEPVAQVHKVVPGASFRGGDGGGFPWLVLLAVPAALALAVAGLRGRAWRPRLRPLSER